jgi:hypothetical protein
MPRTKDPQIGGPYFIERKTEMNTKAESYAAVHLVDIENLCGCGKPNKDQITRVCANYYDEVGVQEGDLVVVASGTQNRFAVYEGWPGAVYQFRPGENGADIALAQFICENKLETKYVRAFLGSGDGGLAPYLELLSKKGIDPIVVSRKAGLSYKLNKFEHIFVSEVKEK